MSDEEALLLTLLDRPGDLAARLVYADWLEDRGEDDLAHALRLDAALAGNHSARRQRAMQTARLRELRDSHQCDWVELNGLLLAWPKVLLLLRRRLAEAAAWCAERDGKNLRTPELLPQCGRHASGIEALWRCRRPHERTGVVHQLGNRRATQLGAAAPSGPAADLEGGKLLLFEPDLAANDGAARLATGSYLDVYQTPAWDTWLLYFDDGSAGRRRAHSQWEAEWIMRRKVLPVAFASYLAAWVPPQRVQAVDWYCADGVQPGLAWAESVDCALTAQLREAGWLHTPEREQAVARVESWIVRDVEKRGS